jgi:uncharacterized protein
MKRITWTILTWLALLPMTQAASFDCRSSHTFIEKAICADKQLSKLDDQLGQAYKISLADTPTPNEARLDQENWLGKVRNVCQDKECLVQVYESRIKGLGPSPTSTYIFAGTSWRAPAAYNDTVEFREHGVVAHKSSRGYSYGQWKVEKGVLRFDNNNYTHYEAKIDGDWLVVSGNNPNTSWSTRWYRTDYVKIDKDIKRDFDQSIQDFRNTIEAARLSVLNESPETEATLQQGKGEQFKGKHWLSLCEDSNLRINAVSIASSMGKNQSDLCYHWYGTRHDWKETILKEGCQDRCR